MTGQVTSRRGGVDWDGVGAGDGAGAVTVMWLGAVRGRPVGSLTPPDVLERPSSDHQQSADAVRFPAAPVR